MSKLPTYTVFGRKVRAHNVDCASSFREDRKLGLIYGSVATNATDGAPFLSWEQASVELNFCVYCGLESIGG